MTKAKPDTKPNWSSFTKAELIRTVKALDKRQTVLLNQVAKLQAGRDAVAKVIDIEHDQAPNPLSGTVLDDALEANPARWPWRAKS